MSELGNKVNEYLKNVRTVSLATCNQGKPTCRIMELQKVEEGLSLLFVAHKSTPKIEQINKCNDACIVSSNLETLRDIRLFGKLETSSEMEMKKIVWKDSLKKYFADGINDPELIVIKFIPENIEYRDMATGSFIPETESI